MDNTPPGIRYYGFSVAGLYHDERPHLAKDNLPPLIAKAPNAVDSLGPDSVVCHERLGGLLKHYQRQAA
jgi:putative transposase